MLIGTRRAAHISGRAYFTNPLAIFAVLLLVGIFFAVIAFGIVQRQSQYTSEGVAAQAVVIDKDTYTRVNRNNVARYHEVTYEFVIDGQTYRSTNHVDQSAYESLAIGDSLDILYMAHNPADSVPASYQNTILSWAFVGIALLVNGIAITYGIRQLRRR